MVDLIFIFGMVRGETQWLEAPPGLVLLVQLGFWEDGREGGGKAVVADEDFHSTGLEEYVGAASELEQN